MSIATLLARKGLIWGQNVQHLTVDPELLAGNAPAWAVSWIRSGFLLALVPFIVWFICAVVPEGWVIGIGHFMDKVIWSHIKVTRLAGCTAACRDLAFGMIVLPVCWTAGLCGAVHWHRCMKKALDYQLKVIRQQPQPTSARPSIDSAASIFQKRSEIVILVFVSLLILHAVMILPIGQLGSDLVGSAAVVARTRFSYCFACTILTLGTAVIGMNMFVIQRISKLRRE